MNKSKLSWTAYLLALFLPLTYSAFAQDQADKPEGDDAAEGDAPAADGGGDAPAGDAPAAGGDTAGGGDAPAADAPAPAAGGDAPAADAPAPAAGGDAAAAPAAPAADAAPAPAPAADAAAAPAPAPASAPAAPAGDAPAAPAPAPAAPAAAPAAPATAAPAPAPAAPAPVAPAPAPVVTAPAPAPAPVVVAPPPPPPAPPPPPPPPVINQSAILQSNPVTKMVVATGGELKVSDVLAAGAGNIIKAASKIIEKVQTSGPASPAAPALDIGKSMKGSARAIQLAGGNSENIDKVLDSIDDLSNEDFDNLADISIDEASSGKLAEVNNGESFDVTNITKRAEVRKKLVDKGLDATKAVDLLVESDNNDKAGSNKGFLDSLANFDDENFDEIFSDDINLDEFELEDFENIAEEVVVADAYVEAGISFDDYKQIKEDFGDTFIDQFEAVSADDLKVSLTAKVQSGVDLKDTDNLTSIVADVIETSNLIKESGGDATEFLNKLGNAVVKDINGLPLILQDGDKFTWSNQLNNLEFFIVEAADDDWDYSDAPEISRIRISKDGFMYGTDSEEAAVSIPELLSDDFDFDAPESGSWKDQWELLTPSVLSLKWQEEDEYSPVSGGEYMTWESEALVKILNYNGNPIEVYLEFGPPEIDEWGEYFAESYDQAFLDTLEAAKTFEDLPASVKEFIADDMEDRINGYDYSTFLGDPTEVLNLYNQHWERQAEVLLETANGDPFLVTFQVENDQSQYWDKAVHFNNKLDGASITVVNATWDSEYYLYPPNQYGSGYAAWTTGLAEEPRITTYTFGENTVTWTEDGVAKSGTYSVLGEGILKVSDEYGVSYFKPYMLNDLGDGSNFYIKHFEFEDGFDADEYEYFRYGWHDYGYNYNSDEGEVELLFTDEASAYSSVFYENLLGMWHNSIFKDTDGDGRPDIHDAFPEDDTEWADHDDDGTGDNSDPDLIDSDGDGTKDFYDAFPYDPEETADLDGDGVGDNADEDRDGDGHSNNVDAFPDDRYEWLDSDGDGIGDNGDTYKYDPFNEYVGNPFEDDDADGILNRFDGMYGDPYAINDDGNEDDDQDGIPNYADAHHPFNVELISMNILFDSDNDGILDLADIEFDELETLMLSMKKGDTVTNLFTGQNVEHIEDYVFHELYNDWSLSSKRKVQKTIDLINILMTERSHLNGGNIKEIGNLIDMEFLDREFNGADSDTFIKLMLQFNAIGDSSKAKKDKIEHYLNELLNNLPTIGAGEPEHVDGLSGPYYGDGINDPHNGDGLSGPYYGDGINDPHNGDGISGPYYGDGISGPYYGDGINDPHNGDGINDGPGSVSKYANLLDELLSMDPPDPETPGAERPLGDNRARLSFSNSAREDNFIAAGLDFDVEDINFRLLSSHTTELSGEFHDSDFDEEPKDVDLTIFASGRDTILRVKEDKISPSDPDLKITMDADNGIQNVTDAYVIASADELYLRDEWTSVTHSESYADPDPYIIEVENASLALASVDTMHLINVDISTQGSLAIATLDDLNLRSTRDDNVFKVGDNGVRNEGLFLYASNELSLSDLNIQGNVDDIYMEATTINLRDVTFPEKAAVLLRSKSGTMSFSGPIVTNAVNFRNVKHLGVDKVNVLGTQHFDGTRTKPEFNTSNGRPRIEVQGWSPNP